MRVNTTIDNVSPLILYSARGWEQGDPSNDDDANQYFQSTFAVTNERGASASFQFNGTGVWIFGARKLNRGEYRVTLDGQDTTASANSFSSVYQEPLFGAINLPMGPHELTITNLRTLLTPNLDIDFITWETEIGDAVTIPNKRTLEESDLGFQYLPSAASWGIPTDTTGFSGGSGRSTSENGASWSYSFQGEAIEVYGSVGPDHGTFAVQLDGGPIITRSGFSTTLQPQNLLFFADSLGPGIHTIRMVNSPQRRGVFDIDFVVVSDITPATPTSTTNAVSSTPGPSSPPTSRPLATSTSGASPSNTATSLPANRSNGVSVPVVVGSAIGALVLIALAIVAFILLRRRRRRSRDSDVDLLPDPDPLTFPQVADMRESRGTSIYPASPSSAGMAGVGGGYGHRGNHPSQPSVARYSEYWAQNGMNQTTPYPPIATNSPRRYIPPSQAMYQTSEPSVYGGVAPSGSDPQTRGYQSSESHVTSLGGGRSISPMAPMVSPAVDGSSRRNMTIANPSEDDPRFYQRDIKGRPIELPLSVNQSLAHIPPEELAQRRMQVEGREQDFGALAAGRLPPNYDQATETWR